QGARYRWPLPLAAEPGACSQHRREKPDPGPGSRTAGLADDAGRSRTPHAQLRAARTTSLFAALDVASGFVIGKCYRRHRATEVLTGLQGERAILPVTDMGGEEHDRCLAGERGVDVLQPDDVDPPRPALRFAVEHFDVRQMRQFRRQSAEIVPHLAD